MDRPVAVAPALAAAVRIAAHVDGPVPWVTQVIALRLNLASGASGE